jgi:hypothetical protein
MKECQHATWKRYAQRLGSSGGCKVVRVALQQMALKGKGGTQAGKQQQTGEN